MLSFSVISPVTLAGFSDKEVVDQSPRCKQTALSGALTYIIFRYDTCLRGQSWIHIKAHPLIPSDGLWLRCMTGDQVILVGPGKPIHS